MQQCKYAHERGHTYQTVILIARRQNVCIVCGDPFKDCQSCFLTCIIFTPCETNPNQPW